MKIGSVKKTKEVINKFGFQIKKKYGQNFLIDENILNNIVSAASIDDNTGVIEIGPGIGSLTEIIANRAKNVLAYEIDQTLIPILKYTLNDYKNVQILNQDILKADVKKDIEKYFDVSKIVLIANLPYYITTPILLNLLEQNLKIETYVVMMQKEVADRICSKPNVKDYNSLSIAIQYRANVKKIMSVPKTVFIPNPNVDSAVVRLDVKKKNPKPKDEAFFFNLVRSSFMQRRKTLVNNLYLEYKLPKEKLESILTNLNFETTIRSEALSLDDFIKLSDYLCEVIK